MLMSASHSGMCVQECEHNQTPKHPVNCFPSQQTGLQSPHPAASQDLPVPLPVPAVMNSEPPNCASFLAVLAVYPRVRTSFRSPRGCVGPGSAYWHRVAPWFGTWRCRKSYWATMCVFKWKMLCVELINVSHKRLCRPLHRLLMNLPDSDRFYMFGTSIQVFKWHAMCSMQFPLNSRCMQCFWFRPRL